MFARLLLIFLFVAAPLVGPGGAMLIGLIGAAVARMGKKRVGRRIDDGGDIFAIHRLSGVAGALALPLFVQPQLDAAQHRQQAWDFR